MTFATASLYVETNRKVRRVIRPYFMAEGATKSNSLYYFLGWIMTCIGLNYLVGPFVMLTYEASMTYWGNFRWFFHILLIVTFLALPGKPKKAKTDEKKTQ